MKNSPSDLPQTSPAPPESRAMGWALLIGAFLLCAGFWFGILHYTTPLPDWANVILALFLDAGMFFAARKWPETS
jgi:hypothetical protein